MMAGLNKRQRGFTLIELMVATSAFSVILIVCLAALLAIGRMYYKGSTEARVQEVVRSTVDNVTQAAQFSGAEIVSVPAPGTTGLWAYCVGVTKYSYYRGMQLNPDLASPTSTQSNQGLVVSYDPDRCYDSSGNFNPSPDTNPQELLGEDMHLVDFYISETDGLVDVRLKVAYGGDASIPNDIEGIFDYNDANGNNIREPGEELMRCKTNAPGSEFCAFSQLSSKVFRKIQ